MTVEKADTKTVPAFFRERPQEAGLEKSGKKRYTMYGRLCAEFDGRAFSRGSVREEVGKSMYQIGDKIVHPMHGAGVIESVVEEKIGRTPVRFYVFKMPISGLTLKIPTANADMIGIRAVSSVEEIEAVIDRIPALGVDMTAN